ncbi:MAG: hypothetical protein Tsb002_33660 [Wenzhouxiangellaceae bacterium]
MHSTTQRLALGARSFSQLFANVLCGALVYSSSLSAQCTGSTTGMSISITQTAGGPTVSCVNPNTSYRMQIFGPNANTHYCINADLGFTIPNSISGTRVCLDATYGDRLEPHPVGMLTNTSLPGSGISGSIEPNACASNPFTFSLPACSSSGSCVNTPSSIRGWWKFDEASGTTAIDSASSNNGTLINGPIRTNGFVSRALDFDGVNDYVSVPDANSLDVGTGDFSIEAWIRTADSNAMIVSKRVNNGGGNYVGYLFMVNSGRLLVQLADPSNSWRNYADLNGPRVDDLQWHHVAITVDRNNSSGGRIYLDGVNIFTFNPTTRSGNLSNSSSLTIGRTSDSSNYFDGQIDEVALYGKALTQTEVRSIFNAGRNGKCSSSTPGPLTATVNCLRRAAPVSTKLPELDAVCLASASGGTGSYSYTWGFTGDALISPDGSRLEVFGCTTGGRVSVIVNDGTSTTTALTLLPCGN